MVSVNYYTHYSLLPLTSDFKRGASLRRAMDRGVMDILFVGKPETPVETEKSYRKVRSPRLYP